MQKRAPHAVRHLFVAVIASIISYASRVSTDILTNIMQASLRCCSHLFSAAFPSHPSSLHPGIPAHLPSFSPIIPRAIPHNSKCRYGERGAADAKPKAQIILESYRAFWQRRCRAAAAGAVLKPQGGNCAVLPKVYLKSKNAGYFPFSAAPQQKSSGQQSASRCLPYYNSAPGCSAPLHLNYSSLSSGISSSKASIQLSLCHLSFSPFSLAATFCRCAWSFIMVPIGFSARSSIMW